MAFTERAGTLGHLVFLGGVGVVAGVVVGQIVSLSAIGNFW